MVAKRAKMPFITYSDYMDAKTLYDGAIENYQRVLPCFDEFLCSTYGRGMWYSEYYKREIYGFYVTDRMRERLKLLNNPNYKALVIAYYAQRPPYDKLLEMK